MSMQRYDTLPIRLRMRKLYSALPGSDGSVRLVADENCDFSVVTDLRVAGYDVVSITEQMAGADDQTVIEFARSEQRLLLTEDQGFWTARICRCQTEFRRHSNPLSCICSVRAYRGSAQIVIRQRGKPIQPVCCA